MDRVAPDEDMPGLISPDDSVSDELDMVPRLPRNFVRPTTTDMFCVLSNVAASRLSRSPRLALDVQLFAEAHEASTSREADKDEGASQFERELESRLEQLGTRSRETREANWKLDNIDALLNQAPGCTSVSTWFESAARDLPPDTLVGTRRIVNRALDDLLKQVQDTCDELRKHRAPLQEIVRENYAWIRRHSTLLGIHSAASTRCPCCMTNQVSVFNYPCGHTMCEVCLKSMEPHNKCWMCREPIQDHKTLFYNS